MLRLPKLNRQDGFTMIEIIAVLILIGILAAVAVPKFMSLQKDAELKSVAGVKSELISRANQYYAQYLLTNDATGKPVTAANWRTEILGDDFSFSNAGGGAVLRIIVTASSNQYNIEFGPALYASNGTGHPATFGAITAQ